MRIPASFRLSLALALLTVSIIMCADLLGLLSDPQQATLASRQKFCESLALQFSSLLSEGHLKHVTFAAEQLAQRNEDIISAAIREESGELIVSTPLHSSHWQNPQTVNKTGPTQVQVPLFEGNQLWGNVEIIFAPMHHDNLLGRLGSSKYGLILFVGIAGFLGYWVFMRRTLRQLDPSSVVPERVQAAFNALAEGVLILDNKEQILLANQSMGSATGEDSSSLIGRRASALEWSLNDKDATLPWLEVIRTGRPQHSVRVYSQRGGEGTRRFSVNCTPIFDSNDKRQGVLATFDDLTEVEQKNLELQSAMSQLEDSNNLIEKQNHELRYLAERDPLTSCLNRRSFNERGNALFKTALLGQSELCCLMVDIDKFKAINDNFGHEIGDYVIKAVGKLLQSSLREVDVLSRWGGEEFCVVLPGSSESKANIVAERIRRAMRKELTGKHTDDKIITVSIGLASIKDGVDDLAALINKADHALYYSKRNGRNRVTRWTPALGTMTASPDQADTLAPRSEPAKTAHVAPQDNRLSVRIRELEQENRKQSRALEIAGKYDDLTGLPKRCVFLDNLEKSIARARHDHRFVAIISLSTAVYKRISDTLGYDMAAQLMSAISERLQSLVRASDIVALIDPDTEKPLLYRVDGDEFGMVIPNLERESTTAWIVQRMLKAFQEPLNVDSYAIPVQVQIGVSVYPNDGDKALQLTTCASRARYQAHSDAKPYHFYSPRLNAVATEQLQLESDLIKGLRNGEFMLHFQPIYDAKSQVITGVEALSRWRHPSRGLVPTNLFIEIAENSGLMPMFGKWVIREAISQASRWDSLGHSELQMSINVSAKQLREPGFLEYVLAQLDSHGVPASRIELEITETALMVNIEQASQLLKRLRQKGIKIAIDDFGVGYSSLSYLKRLQVDTIKIDRSFVSDIGNSKDERSIVSAVIALAHSFNLDTVCEGIETANQAATVRGLHCDRLQGYHFSKPLSPELLAIHLKNQSASIIPRKSAS